MTKNELIYQSTDDFLKRGKYMKRRNNSFLYCCSIIALCFLWTSCGYLSWLYRLLEYTTPNNVDLLSEVMGYIFQAIGILAVSFLIKNNKEYKDYKKLFTIHNCNYYRCSFHWFVSHIQEPYNCAYIRLHNEFPARNGCCILFV